MANDQAEVGLPAGVGSGWAGRQSDSPEGSRFRPHCELVCTQKRDGRGEKGRGRRGRKGEEMKERRERKERKVEGLSLPCLLDNWILQDGSHGLLMKQNMYTIHQTKLLAAKVEPTFWVHSQPFIQI